MKKVDWLVTSLINSSTNMELKNVFRIDTIKLGAIVRKVQKKRTFVVKVEGIDTKIRVTGFCIKSLKRKTVLRVNVEVVNFKECMVEFSRKPNTRFYFDKIELFRNEIFTTLSWGEEINDLKIFLKLFGLNEYQIGKIKYEAKA